MKSDINTDDSVDLLIFTVSGRDFAVISTEVSEISDKVPVTPAPFTDHFVSGLVSLSGRILPQIDLPALLGDAATEGEHEALVVLRGERAPCAIAVDKVREKATVPADAISGVESDDDGEQGGFVMGEFRWQDTPVIVLSSAALSSLALTGETTDGESAFLAREENEEKETTTERVNFLKLIIGREAYALAMSDALEIIDAEGYAPIPGAPNFIRGLALVREQSLLVASAGMLMGLGEVAEDSVLVTRVGDTRAGISVTTVDSILSVPEDQVRRFNDPESRLAGVVHAENDSILGLLSIDTLLTVNEKKAITAHTPNQRRTRSDQEVRITRSVLEVEHGNQHFGIPVSSVERIIDYNPPRPLPSDNQIFSGAIEYESRVLPVLSGDLLCDGKEGVEFGAFVILIDGRDRQCALPVEQAYRIREVDEKTIKPLEQRDGGLIREVAQFGGRLLSMVNPSALTDMQTPELQQETGG